MVPGVLVLLDATCGAACAVMTGWPFGWYICASPGPVLKNDAICDWEVSVGVCDVAVPVVDAGALPVLVCDGGVVTLWYAVPAVTLVALAWPGPVPVEVAVVDEVAGVVTAGLSAGCRGYAGRRP